MHIRPQLTERGEREARGLGESQRGGLGTWEEFRVLSTELVGRRHGQGQDSDRTRSGQKSQVFRSDQKEGKGWGSTELLHFSRRHQEASGCPGICILTCCFSFRSWLGQSRPPRKAPELVRPAIYQTLRCHDIACMSARGEKPDLSILGSDLFNLNFLTQEKEGNEAAHEEP